jgi:hypothetical protein
MAGKVYLIFNPKDNLIICHPEEPSNGNEGSPNNIKFFAACGGSE